MSNKFLNLFNLIVEQSTPTEVDNVVRLFCKYYKTNEQLLKFLSKYDQFVDKDGSDRDIFNQYIDQLEEQEYSVDVVKGILIWLSLIIPENVSESFKYHLIGLHSYVGGLHGSDDEIVFEVINLKTLKTEFKRYFVYKPQRKVVLNKMIYKQDSIYALYGYVKKYVGDGIEKAL